MDISIILLIIDIKTMKSREPTVTQVLKQDLYPAGLLPMALIHMSSTLMSSTSLVFALLLNDLVRLAIQEGSHHQTAIAVVVAFFVSLLATFIGSAISNIGKKLKYDIDRHIKYNAYDFEVKSNSFIDTNNSHRISEIARHNLLKPLVQ